MDSFDRDRIIELRRAGVTIFDISQQTGFSISNVRHTLSKAKVVLSTEQRSKAKIKIDADLAAKMRSDGQTIKAIADFFGMSTGGVKSFFKRMNITVAKEVRVANATAGIRGISEEVRAKVVAASHSSSANLVRSQKMQARLSSPEARKNLSQQILGGFAKRGPVSKYVLRDIAEAATKKGLRIISDQSPDSVHQISEAIRCQCHCGNTFEPKAADVLYGKVGSCGCVRSSYERELVDFLGAIGFSCDDGTLIYNSKKIIPPLQLDFFVPGKMVAIEFCGLFFHSEIGGNKARGYHRNKYVRCRELGIDLITIFSDEWLSKPELCKTVLANRLGVGVSSALYARNLVVDVPTEAAVRQFMEQHHLQGFVKGTHVALIDRNNQPVAMITHRSGEDGVRIERYAVVTNVIGGFAKLVKNIVNNTGCRSITTFSDNRWFAGKIYERTGFGLVGETEPSYWYTKADHIRIHKSNFRKERIPGILPEETEWQAMQRLGYDRIWDCGKKKWVLAIDTPITP